MKRIRSARYRETLLNSLPPVLQKLAKAGLTRMWHHMMNSQFGILSAHTSADSQSQEGRQSNNEKQRGLKTFLAQHGVSFFNMSGAWDDEELNQYIPEDSLFIVGIDKESTKELAAKFDQYAFIWGKDGKFTLEGTEDGKVMFGGRVDDFFRTLKKDEEEAIEQRSEDRPGGYSNIKGRRWVLDPDAAERAQELRERVEDQNSIRRAPGGVQTASTQSQLKVHMPQYVFYWADDFKKCKYMKSSAVRARSKSPDPCLLDAFILLRKR